MFPASNDLHIYEEADGISLNSRFTFEDSWWLPLTQTNYYHDKVSYGYTLWSKVIN